MGAGGLAAAVFAQHVVVKWLISASGTVRRALMPLFLPSQSYSRAEWSWCRRERPSLVLEPGSGRPLALINGALNLAGVGRQQAYTLTVPIRHAASDSGAKQ